MRGFLERRFHLVEHGTTPRTEVLAGLTTFLTLAYILFVQPALLSSVGLDFGAVFVATCVASAFATLLMAGLANYPIAVAPAMGHNFYFTFAVVVAMEVPWEVALGGVAVAGLLFIATAGFGLRERLITAIPTSLKHAIATGIGLLIAMVGLQWSGVIVASAGTLVTLGDLRTAPVLVSLLGLVVMAVLWVRGVRVAILLGILASTFAGWLGGLVHFQGVAGLPPSLLPTLGQFDILGALRPEMVAVIFVFFFLALFDSVGTLVAVGEQAGLMRHGTLPRARGALLADAIGTVVGAGLGTSTVTAYIESATGVAAGGRTGLTAVVVALLFLLSLFLSPLVSMIGGGYDAGSGVTLYPVVAPALILVGTMMVRGVRRIDWDDPTEALPSFLTLIVMPLAVSVTDGIAFGFIAYALLKVATGRWREAHWLVYLFAVLFLVRYAVHV
ncbi:MAG: NCS2 family permease [Vicinamibacterales bacterium]|jgi:AGZA family xanthine/uracil permease-like MFS transporter|nr:NCS2 family permease [Vicinamibacterales bacterium]